MTLNGASASKLDTSQQVTVGWRWVRICLQTVHCWQRPGKLIDLGQPVWNEASMVCQAATDELS